jgi:hypothetical protein
MDIRTALDSEHSKQMMERIVAYIGTDKNRFDELLTIFLDPDEELRLIQRAAWPLAYVGEKNPTLLLPYTPQLFAYFDHEHTHDAIKRNILRAYRFVDIPVTYHDIIVEKVFPLLLKLEEPSAIKAFGMDILGKIFVHYPELMQELCLVIKDRWEHEQPGFKSVGRKILKKYNK